MANVGNGASGSVLTGNGRMSSPNFASLGIRSGLTANGVVISQDDNAFTATASGTTGQALISNGGSGSDPTFGTLSVPGGGTGLATLTANQLMSSGTTATGNMQQISNGTANQILASTGSTSVPAFQTLPVISSWVLQGGSTIAAPSTGYFVNGSPVTITLPSGNFTRLSSAT